MHVQSMDGVDLLHHHSQELIKLVLRLTSDGMAYQNAAVKRPQEEIQLINVL